MIYVLKNDLIIETNIGYDIIPAGSRICETPLAGYVDKTNDSDRDESNQIQFTKHSRKIIANPKTQDTLVKKLKLVKYNIVLVFSAKPWDQSLDRDKEDEEDEEEYDEAAATPGDPKSLKNYVESLGVTGLDKSIVIIITLDNTNGQDPFTPWMILHQIGEAIKTAGHSHARISLNSRDIWDDVAREFSDFIDKTPQARGLAKNVDKYGSDKRPNDAYSAQHKRAFTHLFKMKSAREFKHGGSGNYDMDQELIAEFLWHGGKIRMNYPDWIHASIVNKIKDRLEKRITKIFDSMVGNIYSNAYVGNF